MRIRTTVTGDPDMLRHHTALRPLLLFLICLLPTACVKKSTHEVALTDLSRARGEIESLQAEIAGLEAEMAQNARESAALEADLRAQIADLEERGANSAALFEEARQEVYRLEAVLNERGAEYRTLQRRLDALRAVEQEVRERNAIYEDVIGRFRSLMDGGQLSVDIVRGRLVILLPQDVLFGSGSASLGAEGRSVLAEVARVLAEFPDRRFQVEGHTDNVPIATERFPSNWELSSARALAVVRLLAQQGVDPANVSGAAYGEFQPVASNDDREGRARNRRIEIVMLPNLDVIAEAQVPGRD
ncbi:MAG TPA: OmpA family protein [Longimicrobiales bacterium]|nr:OmpA family protein [Longimicrobiales bacterium]